jgi:predicted nuclease of predicted toxin-antitoxin system
MKVLMDECLPIDFRHSFLRHEIHTVDWAGLKGKKNGELLDAAEIAGYDVLLTVDQGISHQQNIASRRIAIIQIRSKTNQIQDLAVHTDAVSDRAVATFNRKPPLRNLPRPSIGKRTIRAIDARFVGS